MNPMIAALQKSRNAAPAAPAPGGPASPASMPMRPEAGPGDAMVEKLAGLEAKLDAILKMLGAEQKQEATEETDEKEAAPNDHGY